MDDQRDANQQSEIGFRNMRSSQTLEKQRVALEESNDRVDQICEEDRKTKDDDDRASDVNDSEHEGKEQDR